MTDFLPFTTDEYTVDAPATALHFERWFRNPIAMFEGAIGAPRMELGAVARLSPGAEIRSRKDATVSAASGATAGAHQFDFMQAGTIRVSYEHRRTNTGGTQNSIISRVRNGVTTVLSTISAGSEPVNAWTLREVDCPVLPGDQILVTCTATTTTSIEQRNTRFQTNGGSLWPGVSARLEGNTYNA